MGLSFKKAYVAGALGGASALLVAGIAFGLYSQTSRTPTTIQVPTVTGLQLSAAESALTRAGLRFNVKIFPALNRRPVGQVFMESPANVKVTRGTVVTVGVYLHR